MGVLQQQQQAIQNERQRELANLEADPFDVESQRRIEEMIRQENVMKNMETALELNPESFASVSMLYISVIVNGTPIKALVDSGAQATIMSHSCAERCGIMRLIDTRFAGEARGVGRAKILGRVHNARMDVGGLELLCSFTVMEGAHLGLLFGLDMLKRHLACIDLKRNALVIDENVIEFLPEHLIPKSLDDDDPADGVAPVVPPTAAGAEAAGVAAATPPRPSTSGMGALMGGAAVSDIAQRQEYQQKQQQIQQQIQAQSPRQAQQQQQQTQFSESSIKALMDLGVSRQEAIRNLEAAGGNLDIAASLIFS
ncbi:DNA damage-inducible protein 1 [Kickxella alabastrina]|nr:DNA damage-inducible protein 1 [Kickxella alabastrina]